MATIGEAIDRKTQEALKVYQEMLAIPDKNMTAKQIVLHDLWFTRYVAQEVYKAVEKMLDEMEAPNHKALQGLSPIRS